MRNKLCFKIITSVFIIALGIIIYFWGFSIFVKLNIAYYIHEMIEPKRIVLFDSAYIGYLYSSYSLILILLLLFIRIFINKKYYISVYILISLYLLIAICGLYEQFW